MAWAHNDAERAIACDVISHMTVAVGHVGVLQLVDIMILCVILACHNRSGRYKGISFFRIPAVITHRGPQDLELSKKRRNGYIAAISRENITETVLSKRSHVMFKALFVRQAYDVNNPDWLPTLPGS